jgi:acyl-CoA thioesterase
MTEAVEEWLGAVVQPSDDGASRVRMVVEARHLNGAGFVHGGVLFALADVALAHAVIIPGAGATVTAHISFVAPSELGQELVATAAPSTSWGANTLVDVTVRSEQTVVAVFQGQARLRGR